jgi:hypothetical protein
MDAAALLLPLPRRRRKARRQARHRAPSPKGSAEPIFQTTDSFEQRPDEILLGFRFRRRFLLCDDGKQSSEASSDFGNLGIVKGCPSRGLADALNQKVSREEAAVEQNQSCDCGTPVSATFERRFGARSNA